MNKRFLMLVGVIGLFNVSCNKESEKIKASEGSIDIITNVYHNASKSLDDRKTYHISKMSFQGDNLLEIIPDLKNRGFINKAYLIIDTLAYAVEIDAILEKNLIFKDVINKGSKSSIYNKLEGAKFNRDISPENYNNRKELNDTILFGKNYKRIQIKTEEKLSQFYIYQTDTILPYSLNKVIERDYSGRIERVDFYDKKNDLFITIILISKGKLVDEGKEIFELNQYADKLNLKK